MGVSAVNIQAIVGIFCFAIAIIAAKIINAVNSGYLPGSRGMVTYLRVMLGFFLTASIVFVFYSFMGVNLLFKGA